MNRFVRRVLGEDGGQSVDLGRSIMNDPPVRFPNDCPTARDYILNGPDRPEIERRYEQVFWDIWA